MGDREILSFARDPPLTGGCALPENSLSPARWQRIKGLVADALELPVHERGAFLDRACAEVDLRSEVESFLDASSGHTDFLESPTSGSGEADSPSLSPGDRIASFEIVRKLGEGGMGEVFLAQQQDPLERRVALKILRSDRAHRQIVARFELERRALAVMSHPNIARIFDAGSHGDRPYLAMELVSGLPITDHCDLEASDVERRIELFMAVCRGVQHAHRKGILHRDLKPSNILITTADGKPRPKIIDFGIAKATVSTGSGVTLEGQWLGTPDYMSPEQADGAESSIDTRSDVYSLGVVLYQLLTGTLPFDTQSLRTRGLAEMLRVLRQEPAQLPSRRVHGLAQDDAERVAAARKTTPDGLVRTLRGDLDHLLAMALSKDPDDRYGSPADLAQDLQRFLDHRPLVAGPAGLGYRTRKLMRRHRVAMLVAAGLLLSLTLGILGTTAGLVRARQAERRSQEQARLAKIEAARASREAATATRVTDFMVGLFHSSDPGSLRVTPNMTLRQVLDAGAARIRRELRDEPLVQARLMGAIGYAHNRLGLFEPARELVQEALTLQHQHPEADPLQIAENHQRLSEILRELAEFEAGLAHLEKALQLREQHLGADHYEVSWTLNDIGILKRRLNDPAGAGREPYPCPRPQRKDLRQASRRSRQNPEQPRFVVDRARSTRASPPPARARPSNSRTSLTTGPPSALLQPHQPIRRPHRPRPT